MDFIRMSVLPSAKEELFGPSPTEIQGKLSIFNSKFTPPEEDATSVYAACTDKCIEILPLIVDKKFQSKYWTLPIGIPDCYVYSHRSSRCILLEVITLFPESQMDNLHTYNFTTHPMFEEKVNTYTRCKGKEKPNPNLVRSRPWDVALNVVMKIEAVPMPFDRYRYLLKREYGIMEYMWETYLDKNMDIDEMTGIPMIFEYVEVPNDTFYTTAGDHQVDEIDIFGKMKRIKFSGLDNSRSTLAYMTMEKLGPSVSYLQQLVRATQSPPFNFDLWTALKIFDQLLCRIMQVHRFGVVHNDVCPENVYMGNGVAFDVVYLNNYKRAYIIPEGDKEGPSGLAGSCIGCNIRFASVGQLIGSARQMRPIDDVESAFYILIAMLNADALPWDSVLKIKRSSEYSLMESGNNAFDDQTMQVGPGRISTDVLRKMLDFKQRFWQSNQILNLILSNAACVFSSDECQATNVTALIREVYFRIKDWRHLFKGGDECFNYCKKLGRPTSQEFRQFIEIRKCALIHFKFSETFDIINDITFRKKVANQLKTNSLQQQPWNAFVWCFNNIEIRTEVKLSSMAQVNLISSHSVESTAGSD